MSVPLLLIEEPEAHLHPQMQLQLMSFLEEKCGGDNPIQVLLTTHSPNLASNADLESVVLTHKGRAFPLESRYTRLDASDYRFLRRFLDVTKANLFFAKGVVIVEGDAENILLPVFAELLGTSFSKHGVSIVNVGSRGLFRYARIFERKDGAALPTRVACVADRDVPPDEAKHYLKKRTNRSGEEVPTFEGDYNEAELAEIEGKIRVSDGATVKTFVSPTWTFEHDLACGGLAEHVHVAVQLARALKNKPAGLGGMKIRRVVQEARSEFAEWRDSGLTPTAVAVRVYEDLYYRRASKAETAQVLAEILRRQKPNREFLEAHIPAYITEAIGYVTS